MVHSTKDRDRWIMYALIILLCLVLVSFWLTCNIYAKFAISGSGSDDARVALWGNSESITLAEGNQLPDHPGDSCTYTLNVSNQRGDGTLSKVAQKYDITITNAGNLPLAYTLYKDGQKVGDYEETEQLKTWTVTRDNMTFGTDRAETHVYTLTVTWPKSQNSESLSGIPDYVKVDLYANQID